MFTKFNKEFPEKPGVYLMKKNSKIIYVGKAKNLSKRVLSYFNKTHSDDKTRILVENIEDIDFIICNSELDALILENNLIKKYSPKYNINLKDQKTYPYLLLTNERFPRLLIVKNIKLLQQKRGECFGPFPHGAWGLREILVKMYQIRDCNRDMERSYSRACLKFHMKLCNAPCVNKDIFEEYTLNIQNVVSILRGNIQNVLDILDKKMRVSAEKMEFERAILYREQKREIELNIKKQITELRSRVNEDIFCIKNMDFKYFICVLSIIDGKILEKQFYVVSTDKIILGENPIEEIITNFYTEFTLPQNIILNIEFQAFEKNLSMMFKSIFGRNVNLIFPKISSKRKSLLEMGESNLEREIENYYNKKEIVENGLKSLYMFLNLNHFPFKIECFDISNIQGKDAVASMSVAINGKKSPKNYRRFKIKTKDTPDDFQMMREVIKRRYSKLEVNEFPNLILIDGGIGQLNAVGDILKELGKDSFSDIISIAKKEEKLFKYGESEPYIISLDDEAIKILQRLRDEAHRFGINYHRLLRSKRVISSELDLIKGIGKKRKELLIKRFGSVKRVKSQSLEELEKVLPKSIAIKIKELEKGG